MQAPIQRLDRLAKRQIVYVIRESQSKPACTASSSRKASFSNLPLFCHGKVPKANALAAFSGNHQFRLNLKHWRHRPSRPPSCFVASAWIVEAGWEAEGGWVCMSGFLAGAVGCPVLLASALLVRWAWMVGVWGVWIAVECRGSVGFGGGGW